MSVVVHIRLSSKGVASRNESARLPVEIPAHTMLETALALVDSNISLQTSIEQGSQNLIYQDFLTKYKNNPNNIWCPHHKTFNSIGVSN